MSLENSNYSEDVPEWKKYQDLRVYVIDGHKFSDLDGFYDEVTIKLLDGNWWGRNLDAFDDILIGGFGTPPEGFLLRWRASEKSRSDLGYAATIQYLESILVTCHPTGRRSLGRRLREARQKCGPTIFDDIVSILRDHGPEGRNSKSNVRLKLE